MERKTHTIDASGKGPGRLATEIALLLRGKNKSGFAPYKDMGDFVIVKNAGKLRFSGRKLEQKVYYRHSGYIGGLKEMPLAKLFAKDPAEVLRKAVWGMMPKNKLRARQIKRLRVEK